ncbi:MAG: lipoyl domain-containing protein [Porticoccaceae bacterium]
MPSLGADMVSAKVVEWLVKPGDTLRRGDVIVVVETDKGAIEVEIFEDAVVDELVAPLGADLPVGALLARLRPLGVATAAPAPVRPAPAVVSKTVPPALAEAVAPPGPSKGPKPAPAAGGGAGRRSLACPGQRSGRRYPARRCRSRGACARSRGECSQGT